MRIAQCLRARRVERREGAAAEPGDALEAGPSDLVAPLEEHEARQPKQAQRARALREPVQAFLHRVADEDQRGDLALARLRGGMIEDAFVLRLPGGAGHAAHRLEKRLRARGEGRGRKEPGSAVPGELDLEIADLARRLEHVGLQRARTLPHRLTRRRGVEREDQAARAGTGPQRGHAPRRLHESGDLRRDGPGGWLRHAPRPREARAAAPGRKRVRRGLPARGEGVCGFAPSDRIFQDRALAFDGRHACSPRPATMTRSPPLSRGGSPSATTSATMSRIASAPTPTR